MARALSISELCDDTRDPTTTASQKDTSLAYLETQLRLAKEKGVYLNLSEENKASERHREVVLRFLEEFGGLEGVGRGLAAVGEGCTTEVDEDNSEDEDEDDEPENDEGDDDEKDGSEHDEDQDDDDYDYLFRRTIISPTAHVEITRLKRKGFHFNPICFYCKIQFDADDNPDGCCKSHTRTLPFPPQPPSNQVFRSHLFRLF